eukprot:2398019-Pyramimonas_sp.AAC.1
MPEHAQQRHSSPQEGHLRHLPAQSPRPCLVPRLPECRQPAATSRAGSTRHCWRRGHGHRQ